jgi:Glycoside hydrolase 123 N-terminal domain/Glycoside hydrolase 123, catalytic domain
MMAKPTVQLCLFIIVIGSGFVSAQEPAGTDDAALSLKIIDSTTTLRGEDALKKAVALPQMRLVAPRNGYCSGVVVAGGRGLENLQVKLDGLASGAERIPPECIRIRYAGKDAYYVKPKDNGAAWIPEAWRYEPYPDVLFDTPPKGDDAIPVWVTVRVPAEQKPGDYSGVLRIAGSSVPVRLVVSPWRIPSPRAWTSMMGFIISPESLASFYKVELWSEKHLALVEKELQWSAGLGNRMLTVPVYPRNDFAEHPWVRFRKTEEGYEPDLSVLDKLLPLYAKHVGEPEVLIINAWDPGKCLPRRRNPRIKRKPVTDVGITLVGADGTDSVHAVPIPGKAGSEAVFKPLFDAVRRKVKALGWDENCIMVGWATDRRPTAEQVTFFKKIAPYAKWAIVTHGRGDAGPDSKTARVSDAGKLLLDGGMEIGFYVHPEAPHLGRSGQHLWATTPEGIKVVRTADRPEGVAGGWNLAFPRYSNLRVFMYHTAGLDQYRCFPRAFMCESGNDSSGGMALIPLDFWPVLKGWRPYFLLTYGSSLKGFFRNNTYWLVAPGPAGPLGTTRYEMLREGFQEVEARVSIEKALAGGKLPGDLEKKCRAFLEKRHNYLWKNGTIPGAQWLRKNGDYALPRDWQEQAVRLFSLAGQVADQPQ